MEERPRTIPEQRGFSPADPNRERKYSVTSYTAQYGVTWEEAESAWESSETHKEVEQKLINILIVRNGVKDATLGKDLKPRPEVRGGTPYVAQVGDFETAGSIMQRMGLLQVLSEPSPVGQIKEVWGIDHARERARRLIDSEELQEWLDECIAKGDHNLGETYFRWDDIPERNHHAIKWMLAMRYLEWKYNRGNGPMPHPNPAELEQAAVEDAEDEGWITLG